MSGARTVEVLFPEKVIAERVTTLAAEIAAAKPKDLLVVAILKGSFMFAADLLRAMHRAGLEPHVEFFHLSSYREGTVKEFDMRLKAGPMHGAQQVGGEHERALEHRHDQKILGRGLGDFRG